MKQCKLLLILLLLGTTARRAQGEKEAFSRWSVTPHIGANLWTARYYTSTDKPMDRRLGLTAGCDVAYEVAPRVSVSLGADYVLQRFCNDATSSYKNIHTFTGEEKCSVTVATGRIYFPLTIGMNIWNGLSLYTGIQPGFTLHTTDESEVTIPISSIDFYREKVKYEFDSVHCYLPVGVSYEYHHWVVDLRYFYSLNKNHFIIKSGDLPDWHSKVDANTSWHDSMLQLTLGYRFSL